MDANLDFPMCGEECPHIHDRVSCLECTSESSSYGPYETVCGVCHNLECCLASVEGFGPVCGGCLDAWIIQDAHITAYRHNKIVAKTINDEDIPW
jgi:hypothetical protein